MANQITVRQYGATYRANYLSATFILKVIKLEERRTQKAANVELLLIVNEQIKKD